MPEINKTQRVRLKFIDAKLILRNAVGRHDLKVVFGVENPTASRDFARYLEAGGKAEFIPQRRQYERQRHFTSLYFENEQQARKWLDSVYDTFAVITL